MALIRYGNTVGTGIAAICELAAVVTSPWHVNLQPNAVDASTAARGVPVESVRCRNAGASPRADRENNIRDAVYNAEFRQLATEPPRILWRLGFFTENATASYL